MAAVLVSDEDHRRRNTLVGEHRAIVPSPAREREKRNPEILGNALQSVAKVSAQQRRLASGAVPKVEANVAVLLDLPHTRKQVLVDALQQHGVDAPDVQAK